MFSRFQSLFLLALVSVSTAQTISPQCTTALTTILTDPDVDACLTPSPLLPIVTSPNDSVITPIDNWLTTMCAANPCSNATLAKIVTGLASGCSAEIDAALGVQSVDVAQLTEIVEQYYPPVREALCLKDGNNFCVTETLTNIQNALGVPLNVPELESLASGGVANVTLPSNVTCTNCIKPNVVAHDGASGLNETFDTSSR